MSAASGVGTLNTANASAGVCRWYRFGRVVVVEGNATMATAAQAWGSSVALFTDVPSGVFSAKCPITIDNKGPRESYALYENGKIIVSPRAQAIAVNDVIFFHVIYITSS